MAECNIKKSKTFDEGTTEMDLFQTNEKAWESGKPYFLYGQVVFMSWYP